ncbi:putative WD repeat-containing protein C2E1P5.05 [Lasiodiplodia hormozganensis]|uniref:WD repeat-containing protein C2E1P5.05 n=1 Tax=Lasiodiplodia hormozganensis TaxID=869390 RepID=A0AA39XXU5_9PEZI|nr:putative WD repeat-containing protein C2E1P5.05 [Lasiodiplodia hormozganensis]
MSSFFTTPASQRKRKRSQTSAQALEKRNRKRREDSISSSDSDDNPESRPRDNEDHESDHSSDADDETAAERRLRLAERYLENIREEVDEAGFDAAEIDKDLIAERLKEDVAESKGRVYRRIASSVDFPSATRAFFRRDNHATTAIATHPPYAYTATKDMCLIKWSIPSPLDPSIQHPSNLTPRTTPSQVVWTKGSKNYAKDPTYQHHTGPILCVAVSPDGKFVATGGADKKLIVWRAEDLTPLKVFTQHRDAVISLAFRRGKNQLFSASADRTIKTWSLDELAYVETLFGHQDSVIDIAALAQERCVSVGARDRTARLWKVVEESQLVFRGGGSSVTKTNRSDGNSNSAKSGGFVEGSIDRVALVDEETFVTGSDNGAISLWSIHKKKPVFTVPLAHGVDPPMRPAEVYADAEIDDDAWIPPPQPRWITALTTIPYTDVILSGSWDGWVRAWKINKEGRRIEALGTVGRDRQRQQDGADVDGDAVMTNGAADDLQPGVGNIRGVVNDLSVFERGDRGKDGICVVAAVAKELKLGRWRKYPGKNAAVVFEVKRNVGEMEGHGEGEEE